MMAGKVPHTPGKGFPGPTALAAQARRPDLARQSLSSATASAAAAGCTMQGRGEDEEGVGIHTSVQA